MPKRKTYKEVRAYLAKLDLELQSGYVNINTELKLIHDKCGHIFKRTLNHIYKNPKCPKCHPPKTARKTIEEVRKIVENKPGHKLLSKNYKNNREPIEIFCEIAGQAHVTTLHGYENYRGCGACRYIRTKKTWKPRHQKKLIKIKSEMGKEGYKLVAKEYRSNKQALEYICPKGHRGKISWNNWSFGHRCGDCDLGNRGGESNPRWKGGITRRKLASYDAALDQIGKAEQIRRDPLESEILQARCNYCGKWFRPSRRAVDVRIMALKTADAFEGRLYCSERCKQECPIFHKRKWPEGFKKTTSREVQPELRQMVFERDNWECKKCGKTKSLQCHHIESVMQNPIESADADICITLCKRCHKWAHTQEGCRYFELRCE
jgi:hypothetical protein